MSGYRYNAKDKESKRRYYLEHREDIATKKKARYKRTREQILAEKKEYYRTRYGHIQRAKSFEKSIKRLYGLTVEQYEAKRTAQGGRCAICTSEFRARHATYVDHDHATGAIRDLLCPRCNTILGLSEDSPALLAKLIAYLERHAQRAA